MTIRNLQALMCPRCVALIGASARAGSIGQIILANLIEGRFPGRIFAVNPHPFAVDGATWVADIPALPEPPDLAIIVTPAPTVSAVIGQLGDRGCKVAVVISAGLTTTNGLRQQMLDAARPHLLRIIGPNCLGVAMPHAGLQASFARDVAVPGKLAVISQSGALITAILDWAKARDIGFSGVISVGDMADVDLGDLIDLFANDPKTAAILLYIEGVTQASKFMAAAHKASRRKPVIAIKGGRTARGNKATMSHTGALAGSYDVYQAAFHRAGIIIVDTLSELFNAAEVLTQGCPSKGERLAIITNGGGAGILATDALVTSGGVLADLSAATLAALDAVLPEQWSGGNPVDIIGDAMPDRYQAAIEIVAKDPGVDALMLMNCPTALATPSDVAQTVANALAGQRQKTRKPSIACWLGEGNSVSARPAFSRADIPLFDTPEEAVAAFGYLVAARRAAEVKLDTARKMTLPNDRQKIARSLFAQVRAAGRFSLSEIESKQLLAAYGIPTVATVLAPSVEAVSAACADIPGPYALKIVSPQISHKSDVGGVVLGLCDAASAVGAAREMTNRIARSHPDAVISGFAVESMCSRPGAHEILCGIADDPAFGPVIMVGAGGKAVEILADKALGLPPLDFAATTELIDQTRISRLLKGYRDEASVDMDGLARVLATLSAMVMDLPEIVELDINPLLVDRDGVIALDARVRICAEVSPPRRLALGLEAMKWRADRMGWRRSDK